MPLCLAFQVISGIDVQDNATMEKLVKDVGDRRPSQSLEAHHVAGVNKNREQRSSCFEISKVRKTHSSIGKTHDMLW